MMWRNSLEGSPSGIFQSSLVTGVCVLHECSMGVCAVWILDGVYAG